MDNARRRLLLNTLFGTGYLGLRALATGLPMWMLANPHRASAAPSSCPGFGTPNYLLLITSYLGDPMNANVPGCYADAGIYHSPATTMAPTAMTLSGTSYTAALPWTQLDASLLSRACFFHHSTQTNAHGDAPKVQKLMGAVMRQEMMVSMFAQNLAPCLGTVQAQPVVISQNLISASGAILPVLNPLALQKVLSSPTGVLATLQQQRDSDVNKLNALFKSTGRKADAAILDQYALSQTQARSLSQTLLADLAMISGTTRTDLNIAASVLFKMNVSPAVVMTYSFGGDNHTDVGLANEAAQHVASIAGLNDLWTRLGNYGLQDKVTIALQNVFGRTLSTKSHSNQVDGRNHNADHHASVFFGKAFRPSVIGGPILNSYGSDYRASGFNSMNGLPADASGDVQPADTLASAGKTLGKALGLPQSVLDTQITSGKTVPAALA